MTDVDTVVRGLKCCRNWEILRGILPECAECPFADEDEKTCEDMKKQIDAAIDPYEKQKAYLEDLHKWIQAQKAHIEEMRKWLRELGKAVKWE